MAFSDELLDLDYLIYSSHKTGTQTLRATLGQNGFRCLHFHGLKNIGLEAGDFSPWLSAYREKHRKPLKVITVFREPIERHISSFFQAHGSRPLRLGEVQHESETIVARYTMDELHQRFIAELKERTLIGLPDAMDEIARELSLPLSAFSFDPESGMGRYNTEALSLTMLRFDQLFSNFDRLLAEAIGKPLQQHNVNIGDQKWYREIYKEFKRTVRIPEDVIVDAYEHKKNLIELFYRGRYRALLQSALEKYSVR